MYDIIHGRRCVGRTGSENDIVHKCKRCIFAGITATRNIIDLEHGKGTARSGIGRIDECGIEDRESRIVVVPGIIREGIKCCRSTDLVVQEGGILQYQCDIA